MKTNYQSFPVKELTPDCKSNSNSKLTNSKLKKLRKAGLNPNYWYAFEYERAVKKGDVLEVKFWNTSIALFRDHNGQIKAIENRCAHRQLKLSVGEVKDCKLVCPYHGWSYNGDGKLVEVEHKLFGKTLPSIQLKTYPVRVKYGFIWIFPGDINLANQVEIPHLPELEGKTSWPCVPFEFTWQSHHSMIIDNVNDFAHAHLHRKYQPFSNAKLTKCEEEGDRINISYDTFMGGDGLSKLVIDRDRVETNSIELCFDYPYQWSNIGGKIKHWCFILPVDERTTKVFFLVFYSDALKIPFTSIPMPKWLTVLALKFAKQVLIKPLFNQDGVIVKKEQEGFEAHPDLVNIELNPVVHMCQNLTIKKWDEYLNYQK